MEMDLLFDFLQNSFHLSVRQMFDVNIDAGSNDALRVCVCAFRLVLISVAST